MKTFAFLIGINYLSTDNELKGCIEDTTHLHDLLLSRYKLDEKNIKLLTDLTESKPTHDNIITHLNELASKSNDGSLEELWISYSGHGMNVRSLHNTERDGKDEAIVPIDYKKSGVILDNAINDILNTFSQDTRITIIMDCCHSGTMVDLRWKWVCGSFNVEENSLSKIKSQILLLSSCLDNQKSIETSKGGALISGLIHILESYDFDICISILMNELKRYFKDERISQTPQASCTFKISNGTMFSLNKDRKNKPFVTIGSNGLK